MAGYQVQHIFRLIFQQKLSPKMKSHSMNQTEKSYAIIYTVSQRRQPHRLKKIIIPPPGIVFSCGKNDSSVLE
jgi:hypothetical protein